MRCRYEYKVNDNFVVGLLRGSGGRHFVCCLAAPYHYSAMSLWRGIKNRDSFVKNQGILTF
jgi:hypothetical protein